jgi:transcription termination factor Rho
VYILQSMFLLPVQDAKILLMKEEELQRVWILRKFMADMNSIEAMEFLQSKMKGTRNNEEFLSSMNG